METRTIALFDVDGTLTPARKPMLPDMIDWLKKVMDTGVEVGVVSGSDYAKICEQLGKDVVDKMQYAFFENGWVFMKYGEIVKTTSVEEKLGADKLKTLINYWLHYIADLDIPIKRGTFVEYRTGLLNVSPIGRNCSYDERVEFFEQDKESGVRTTMKKALEEEFKDYDITISIGGQISMDIFPTGWDKRFCLQYLEGDFGKIHFYGDRTSEGGNDHEIYEDERTIGHSVTGPDDTINQLTQEFLNNSS